MVQTDKDSLFGIGPSPNNADFIGLFVFLCLKYYRFTDNATGKLASLSCSWKSKEGMYHVLGMAGIEPRRPSQIVTGPRFRLNHQAKGGGVTHIT